MLGQYLAGNVQAFFQLRLSDFVDLGQHDLKGHRRAVEQGHDFLIHFFCPVPRVDQHEGAAQSLSATEVSLEQALPLFHHGQGRVGISIAGQVDEVAVLGQGEIVDLLDRKSVV